MTLKHFDAGGCATSLALLPLLLLATACGPRPLNDEERLSRGREVVQRASNAIGGARAFSVVTDEVRVEAQSSGEPRSVTLRREMVLQRNPDRLHFRTKGDHDSEGWYDGVGLALVSHGDKVFAQAPMPETLDRALDAISERYGVVMPLTDFLYSSPAKALLSDTLTGGWVGTEPVNGEDTDHVAFKDQRVSWDLWVSRTGDRLPLRFTATRPDDQRVNSIDVTFSDWNLMPDVSSDRFTPRVPPDYQGIAMLQRNATMRPIPEDQPVQTTGNGK